MTAATRKHNPAGRRRGITLMELMIVIVILVIAAALAIPRIKMTLEDQERREAARQVNAYIANAQVRAAQLDRSVGVALERKQNDRNQSTLLYITETPSPYSGDTTNARARMRVTRASWQVLFDGQSGMLYSPNFITAGSRIRIRFDYKGHYWSGRLTQQSPPVIELDRGNPSSAVYPPPPNNVGYRYEIFRNPVSSNIEPLQLPGTTAIDLAMSGMGADGVHFRYNSVNNSPVIIMFHPDGRVENIFYNGVIRRPLGPVHLLVGRNDQVSTATNAANNNLNDLSNFWVSIGHRTGSVATTNNLDSSGFNVLAQKLIAARQLARSGRTTGGR